MSISLSARVVDRVIASSNKYGMRDLIDIVKTILLEEREQWPALEPDPEDSFHPQPMTEPRVLYRSVSIEELKDIWMRGEIVGGRNRFNGFDSRQYVFFADEISDMLVHQGEEIERQASHSLGGHEIHSRFRVLGTEITDQARLILHMMQGAGVKYDPNYEAGFLRGDHIYKMQDATQSVFGTTRANLRTAFQELHSLVEQRDRLYDEYRQLLRGEGKTIRDRLSPLPISSAILVTKPIMGGLHYSSDHGQTGFGDAEFGFAPGQVTSENISEVIFIKAGKEVGRCAYDDLGEQMAQMGLY